MMKKSAFSLVEMLVSMGVFTVVAVVMGTMLANVATSGRRNEGQLAVNGAFRTAAERLQGDWRGAVRHAGFAPVFEKEVGNDLVHFYAQVRTPKVSGGEERLARVSYYIDPLDRLTREVETMTWTDLMPSPLPTGGVSQGAVMEACGAGIFRMEIAFQGTDGRLTGAPPADRNAIRALVVAFAALDPDSLARLSAEEKAALAAQLPDCAATGEMPGESWEVSLFEELPPYVRENVRFYQRWFPVQ